MIEILEINKEFIKFKCINNKHEILIGINEYLEKMKKYNNIKINNDKCNIHNNKYISYCFDCNIHLCKECLKNREHINHYKNYIIEINPNEEELDKLKKMINENAIIINNLIKEEDNKKKELKLKLEKYINNINKLKEEKIKRIENKRNEEIKINKKNYENEIKKLKKEYENKIKEQKIIYIK